MSAKRLISAATTVAILALAGATHADSGMANIATPASVGVLNVGLWSGWEIELTVFPGDSTTNALQHTILDVFSDPAGGLLAEALSTPTVPASLHLGPYVENRPMKLLIRSDRQIQTRFLVGVRMRVFQPSVPQPVADATYTFIVQNTAAATVALPHGLAAGTHVMTGMLPGGSNDTAIMVLRDGDEVEQYDDDDGPGLMSWLHLWELEDGTSPCPASGSCSLFVANILAYKAASSPIKGFWQSTVAEGAPTRVYWDEDVHNGRDADADGLGDGLEQLLGTHWKGYLTPGSDCPMQAGDDDDHNGCKDTDRDGIKDVLEVLGMADGPSNESNPWNLLMFPGYGADPTQQDLFVETHWGPACIGVGCPGKDAFQFSSQVAAATQDRWLPFRLHIDTGPVALGGGAGCGPPELCGDWGGAYRYPDVYAHQNYCDAFSPERQYYFHHMMVGGGGQSSGKCSFVTNNASTPAHELGHQLSLEHYGGHDNVDKVGGCKPHYVSLMNYAYADNSNMGSVVPGFSRGLNTAVLNPSWLDETGVGISTLYPYMSVINSVFGRANAPGGGVDWNMDGRIATAGIVQGPLNYPRNFKGCDRETTAFRVGAWVMQGRDPSLVVDNNELWMVARTVLPREVTGFDGVNAIFTAKASINCHPPDVLNCTTWSGRNGIITSPQTHAPFAPAGAGDVLTFVNTGSAGGELFYIAPPPWKTNGAASEPKPVDVAGTGPRVWGHPVATVDSATGVVSIYAAGGAAGQTHYLMRWDYDPRIAGWTRLGETQYYDNGSPIEIHDAIGPGLTKGYQEGGLDPQEPQREFVYIVLAVPDANWGARTTMIRQVTTTWLSTPVQYWTELPSTVFADLAQSLSAPVLLPSNGRIGLAFRAERLPWDPGPGIFVSGRFYMTFLGLGVGGQAHEPFFSVTQGNVLWDGVSPRPAEREMVMTSFNNFANDWADWPNGGIFLTPFAGNIRGVAQADFPVAVKEVFSPGVETRFDPPNISFYPFADGVIDVDERDYDDQGRIAANLTCSLSLTCP